MATSMPRMWQPTSFLLSVCACLHWGQWEGRWSGQSCRTSFCSSLRHPLQRHVWSVRPFARRDEKLSWPSRWEVTTTAVCPWSYSHVRGRRREIALASLQTGHTRFTHSYLMSQGVQPYCDDCVVVLIVRHLMAECPSLGNLRERFLSRCLHGGWRSFLAPSDTRSIRNFAWLYIYIYIY